MIDKFVHSIGDALHDVRDGATVLIGGFGAAGTPDELVEGLIAQGARNLTIIANNAGYGRIGLARLLAEERVRKLICSYPRIAGSVIFEDLYKAGKLELELVPQGTLAERLRAAGAGVPAFYTATASGPCWRGARRSVASRVRTICSKARSPADVALVDAWCGDRWGNLTYRATGRNFNPVMATAGKITIAQVHNRMELGEMNPESVVTPGIFVDRMVMVGEAQMAASA